MMPPIIQTSEDLEYNTWKDEGKINAENSFTRADCINNLHLEKDCKGL